MHLRKRDLLGYGAAAVADSGSYNFVTVYLILFLTTVVDMPPEKAATIASLTILADGLIGALIGYISDNTKSKYGRRRPYMLASIAPLVLGLVFLFSGFSTGGSTRTVIYVVAGIIFWLGFGIYYTPYTALGAELTDDYDERSVLRTYARYFGLTGNLIGIVLPLLMVTAIQSMGFSENTGWTVAAAFVAFCSGAGIFVTWITAKGKEKVIEHSTACNTGFLPLIKDYVSILKLKPFKYMLAVAAFFLVASLFYNSSMVFFARYSLGIKDGITSNVFLISIIANFLYTPIMGIAAVKFEKKTVMAFCMLISGIAGIAFYFIGIETYLGMILYACIFSLAYSCFWQLINALLYDLSEVGEYKFGKRLEGSISSVYGLIFTICTSLGTLLFGWVLKFGYINAAFMLIPGICLLIAAVFQVIYPLDKTTFDLLKNALQDEEQDRNIIPEGLRKVL